MNFWQSETIRLRAVEPSDAETFYRWNQDSERARYLDFLWPPASLASVRAWTEGQSLRKLENDAFHWVIETLEGEPAGTISTHACDPRNGTFSYGLDVAPEHRRKGYAAAAVILVLRYYFAELRYQKVTVCVHGDNESSILLHRKLGFRLEGTHRRMVYTHGQYLDLLWFGMTTEEFVSAFPREDKSEELPRR
jgi:RimJ/RimL family protein N-acetyltransferase